MSETINPVLNPIENHSAIPVTVESPSAIEPQLSEKDLFAMPMEDLKKAAFDPAAGHSDPQSQPTASQPANAQPFTLSQDGGGFVLKYATGETFKGASETEVYRKAAENAVRNIEWAKQIKKQYEDFQRNPANAVQMPDQPQAQPLPDPAIQQSPEEAQREAAQFLQSLVLTPEVKRQIVAEALSIDPQVLPQTVNGIASTVREFQQNNQLIDFHARCPDYLDTPENAAALGETLLNIVGDVPGYEPTADDLEIAYAYALHKGVIKPHVQQTQPAATRPFVMPSAGASSAGGDQNAWSMDLGDLKKAAGLG